MVPTMTSWNEKKLIGAARCRQGVFESLGGDQAGLGAVAGEQRVVDHGGAVHEHRGLREQVGIAYPDPGGGVGDRVQYTVGEVGRCR